MLEYLLQLFNYAVQHLERWGNVWSAQEMYIVLFLSFPMREASSGEQKTVMLIPLLRGVTGSVIPICNAV